MMCASNPTHATLFFLLISFKLSCCVGNNGIVFCPKTEKQALLSFKQSLKDPGNLLSSWDGEADCCKWKDVVCNNLTGHVHQLRLQSNDYTFGGLSGKINPSLLNLKHLRYLDLSLNNFAGETIPSFIGSLAKLEYLNLSGAGFHGKIPHGIGNLSNLHTLDIGDYLELDVDRLEWLSGLSQLEYLNMDGTNLSRATNWAQVISSLPSLVELRLSSCSLTGLINHVNITTSLTLVDLSGNGFQSSAIMRWIFQLSNLLYLDLSSNQIEAPIPTTISNATKLQFINLSFNQINTSIPDWLYLCKDLEFVDLSYNYFLHGMISNAIANLTSLNTLRLSRNLLSGKIPREIANLCKIRSLDLSYNNLQGEISDSFGNMSECFLGALEFLDLEHNQLSGHLTDQFGEFKRLQRLDLGQNLLSGAIPISMGRLSSLEILRLEDNKLTGNLPESLGQLFSLETLDVAYNMLEGVVTESHFANLTKLMDFSASRNRLTLKVSRTWIPPFQLRTLALSSWNLGVGSRIPSWLETQKNMQEIDLSSTGISGNIPSWFWKLQFLNLSHNHLYGKIPYIYGPWTVILSSNRFSGPLPRIDESMSELDLSNNSFSGGMSHFLCDMTNKTYGLEILHLGGNQLCGELPDCWMKSPYLTYLNLGNNNISGSIPNSIGYLPRLRSLNLYNNKFSGHIPFPMHNCTKLFKVDLAGNELHGNIPAWIGTSLVELKILVLRSNMLSGEIPLEICHLNSVQILDLSDNKFSGVIPRCVYNFTAMATKRSLHELGDGDMFSRSFRESAVVATKGSRLQYDTILSLVTNIDLSSNNLSGSIPKELISLVELRSLNLSKNHLTGAIPNNIGDMKQMESLDLSKNSLWGQIPSSLTLVSSLNRVNLSCNNLTWRIPKSTQLQSLDASSFIGNNLCGPPLASNYSRAVDEVHGHVEDSKGDDIEWFYVFLSLGYAVGFSLVCTTLVLKKSWREAYFGLLECMWDKMYVYVHIKWTRLKKPSSQS